MPKYLDNIAALNVSTLIFLSDIKSKLILSIMQLDKSIISCFVFKNENFFREHLSNIIFLMFNS